MADPTIYRLADPEGGYWIHLPRSHGTFRIDGDEIPRPTNGWIHRDEIPTTLESVRPGGHDVTGYRLIEGMSATEKYPATITRQEYLDAQDNEESTYDARVAVLYEAVRVPREPAYEPLDLPVLELVGAPPGVTPEGLTWAAHLPYELSKHPEYLHLFPGRLNGVHERLKKVLEANGAVVYNHRPGQWEVGKVLPVAGTTRKRKEGRRTVQKPDTIRALVPVPRPPSFIDAANRAEALAQYGTLEAAAVAMIQSFVGVQACPTCKGTGVTPEVAS